MLCFSVRNKYSLSLSLDDVEYDGWLSASSWGKQMTLSRRRNQTIRVRGTVNSERFSKRGKKVVPFPCPYDRRQTYASLLRLQLGGNRVS